MKKWAIQLIGHELDLQYLLDKQKDQEWSITKDNDEYYLSSITFTDLENDTEVESEGVNILKTLNGSALLANSKYKPVVQGHTCILDENGKRIKRFIYAKGSARLSVGGSAILSGGEDAPRSNSVHSRFNLANTNPNFSDAIAIFGKGKENLTWADLYKIQEIITDSGKITEVLASCQVSENTFKNFKLNCNSHESAGEESRHHIYKLTKDNPKFKIDIISKSEAYDLVRTLLLKWEGILNS